MTKVSTVLLVLGAYLTIRAVLKKLRLLLVKYAPNTRSVVETLVISHLITLNLRTRLPIGAILKLGAISLLTLKLPWDTSKLLLTIIRISSKEK